MVSQIFFNVHGQNVPDKNTLLQVARDLQPQWALVMNALGLAQELKGAVPACNVIHRVWPDEKAQWENTTAAQWCAQKKAEIGSADVWCYTFNECGFDDPYLRLTIDIIHEAARVGLKVVVGNMSVGTPQPDDWNKPLAIELLRVLNDHRETAVLGLHEYACGVVTSGFYGGYPDNAGVPPGQVEPPGENLIPFEKWPENPYPCYHLGRYYFMVNACMLADIPLPRVVLTEHGFDDVSDIKAWTETLVRTPPYGVPRGWKSIKNQWAAWFPNWSHERAYFEQLKYADQTLYKNSPVEAQLIFCWGHSSDDWDQFDVAHASELHNLLREYAANGDTDNGGEGEQPPMGKVNVGAAIRGDGRVYQLGNTWAGPENVQCITSPIDSRSWKSAKNAQYEELCISGGFVRRNLDTSSGNGTCYQQRGKDGSFWPPWCPTEMTVGETFLRDIEVIYYDKQCNIITRYPEASYIRLDKVHSSYTFQSGLTLNNVVQMSYYLPGGTPNEFYLFAAPYGLVGWENPLTGQKSFISQLSVTPAPMPEVLGPCADFPTIPPENTSQPPTDTSHPFPPDSDAGWATKNVATIPTNDFANVRAQPTTSSTDIGDIREAKPYSINEAKAVPDPKGRWIPIKGSWLNTSNGWVASWVIEITDPLPVDPPPLEDQTFTITVEGVVAGDVDVEALKEALRSVKSWKFI